MSEHISIDTVLQNEIGGTDSNFPLLSISVPLIPIWIWEVDWFWKEESSETQEVIVSVWLVLILAVVPAISAQAGRSKSVHLDWRQVVPSGSGDPNMLGEATIDVNPGQAQLCYTMRVFIYYGTSDWPPTSAGIYKAPFGENGPLVADLNPAWGPLGQPNVSGCLNIGSALAHDIQRNPTQYYLLLTDTSYSNGAARAQLPK